MSRPDAELVKAARLGDVESFRELYERYFGLAVGVARSRLADRHLAEDAAQEAFATACRRLASLRDGSRFPEWLGTICRRTATRMARAHARRKPIESEPIAPMAADDAGEARIHEAVERLATSAREVVQLHYFGGLSYEEIARVLGTTPQAVHGRLQRARRAIAEWLKTSED